MGQKGIVSGKEGTMMLRRTERKWCAAALWLSVMLLIGCGGQDPESTVGRTLAPAESEAVSEAETAREAEKIYVYVCGAVTEPGVYPLSADARVQDAVRMAGGFTEEADPEALNLARRLSDGEQIRVPTWEEQEQAASGSAAGPGLVNINTATAEELMTLNGIGQAKAEAIISYREREGPFSSIEDVMQVPGIKEAAFLKIRDHITV